MPIMSTEANARTAHKLMSQTSTIVITFDRLRSGKEVIESDPIRGLSANFLYTLSGKRPDDVMERAFDVAMILHADHEHRGKCAHSPQANVADVHHRHHVRSAAQRQRGDRERSHPGSLREFPVYPQRQASR